MTQVSLGKGGEAASDNWSLFSLKVNQQILYTVKVALYKNVSC
jgi:hypothetical protein